jgi:hypothetical protein
MEHKAMQWQHDGLPPPPGQFGAQQNKSSAIARFMAYARGFALNSIILGLFVFAAELLFAPEYKPSHLMGGYVGSVEKAEIGVKQAASVEFTRRQAEAQAQAQANAAIETETARQQQDAVRDSLNVESSIANFTDLGCFLGILIPRDAPGNWQTVGPALRSACGVSAGIRDHMVQEQARATRRGTAIQPREVMR